MEDFTTEKLYYEDAYNQEIEAKVLEVVEYDETRSAIVLDKTVFYPTGGGQVGDKGTLSALNGGFVVSILETTLKRFPGGAEKIFHLFDKSEEALIRTQFPESTEVKAVIDFTERYRLMRMHTSLHLLCSVLPYAVTGGAIRLDKSHLDFDTEGKSLDKVELTEQLNALVQANHSIQTFYLLSDDFNAKRKEIASLVRTALVSPPVDAKGNVRLVQIGPRENPIDLQACGGTHVRQTGEIGEITVKKVENKGQHNRRVRLILSP